MPKKNPQSKTKDNRIIRAVTLPVGAPVNVEWAALRSALKDCWKQATDAANWCIMELFRRDTPNVAANPDCVKMGSVKAGRFYAYGEASKLPWFADWTGGKQSLNIVLQYAHREYLRRRFDVMVRHIQSLLTVRYPYPYPLDADAWSLSYADGGFPLITCTLPSIGKVELRLKRRADFGRQLGMLRQIHDELAKKGEAALYQNSKGDLLVKVVGKFPRREAAKGTHVCFLHTSPAAFMVGEIDGRSEWILNCDHLRRQCKTGGPSALLRIRETKAKHTHYLQRVGEDKKREKRMDRRDRHNLNKSIDDRCNKQNDRLDASVKQLIAQVAKFAQRQGVALVIYDDANRTFLPDGFQWHSLEMILQQQLDALGIKFLSRESLDNKEIEKWLQQDNMTLLKAFTVAGNRFLANMNRRGAHPAITRR